MITPEKIDEWIREAEDRPASASLIIRFISNRLNDLTKWNEELQVENLALRTDRKVEEYEKRIETLEYQIGLLKRQLGRDVELQGLNTILEETQDADLNQFNLLIYNAQGQIIRISISPEELAEHPLLNTFTGEITPANLPPHMLIVPKSEELLLAFDSGRTVTIPVNEIPISGIGELDWQKAYLQTPLGTEELAFIKPIGLMALSDFFIQISRKGCAKKIKESIFETYLGKSYIGTGTKSPPDKTCDLVLCNQGDRIALVSKEGYLQCIDIDPLPATIEDVIRLSVTDHIVNANMISKNISGDKYLLFVTQNGKVIHRQIDWLDTASSYKIKGQAIFSQERRDTGTKIVSAVLAKNDDWGIAIHSDGSLIGYEIGDIVGAGTLMKNKSIGPILGFTLLSTR